MGEMIEATEDMVYRAIEAGEPSVLFFSAEWSAPDRALAPSVEELAVKLRGRAMVYKIDIDKWQRISIDYKITAVPTLLFCVDGEVEDKFVGVSRLENLVAAGDKNFPEPQEIEVESELVAIARVNGKFRVVVLREDHTYKFEDPSASEHALLYPSPVDLELAEQIEEFEELLNDPSATEEVFHRFFERYPRFVLSDEYKNAHSKVVLEREDDGPVIPDFLLEPYDKVRLCDVLELKRPDAKLFVMKKNRPRFSAAVFDAVAQLEEYSRYFDEDRNRRAVCDRYQLNAYKPRLFLIIGRRGNIDPIEFRKAEAQLPQVTLRTFDDVLDRAKRAAGSKK